MDLPTIINGLTSGGGAAAGAVVATAVGWPAARALSRLVAGTFDIAQARLERPASMIRARTEDLIEDRRQLAAMARAAGLPDEDRAERAMLRHVQAQDRRQANVEAVAQKAYEDLSADRPDTESVVSEEFMAAFEPLAEGASTEEARSLFAKVLAGEVRKPGKYSKRTLNFLNLMDKAQADEIESWVGMAWGTLDGPQSLPDGGAFSRGERLMSSKNLESLGLIATGLMTNLPPTTVELPGGFVFQDRVLLVTGLTSASACPLTPLGREVFGLVWRAPSENEFALLTQWVKESGGRVVGVQQRPDRLP